MQYVHNNSNRRNPAEDQGRNKAAKRGETTDIMIEENNYGKQPTELLASEKIGVDRKLFYLDLKQNSRGRYLKITEDVGGRRDTIMLPVEAFQDFFQAFVRLIEYERELEAHDSSSTTSPE